MRKVPAVISFSSEAERLRPPEEPPRSMEPPFEACRLAILVPLETVPLKAMSAAVILSALLPEESDWPALTVKLPEPLLSLSAFSVVAPAVTAPETVMPLLAVTLSAPEIVEAAREIAFVSFSVTALPETIETEPKSSEASSSVILLAEPAAMVARPVIVEAAVSVTAPEAVRLSEAAVMPATPSTVPMLTALASL